eukprot:CAMPEP_0178473154 /NCGR_PEP_ID=MMETSP0696-20121128/1937_1 /TAXON_ID=265572 /ORGANISM="Extubocellulus spinifer, Strain CCMP396" /LENGTH=117 /DNA_ID=CAMNT_0020100361 /DNA_START=13 /DNA_END=366 /DNA_ORIENTATION=-
MSRPSAPTALTTVAAPNRTAAVASRAESLSVPTPLQASDEHATPKANAHMDKMTDETATPAEAMMIFVRLASAPSGVLDWITVSSLRECKHRRVAVPIVLPAHCHMLRTSPSDVTVL